jgi:ADP-ribose pyrophosphatase
MKRFLERPIRRRTLFKGRAVSFRVDTIRLPDGGKATREFLDHPGAVAVLPFLDERTIVLVRQYRYPVGRVTWEIPAGKLDPGEKPRPCILRELREETGYRAGRLRPFLNFWPSPAFANELIRIYVADRLADGRMDLDHDEFLEPRAFPYEQALQWALTGRIRDSKTLVALFACAAAGGPSKALAGA